jgi:RHS repeat-associated protein
VDSSGVVHARYDYDPYGRRGANQVTGANAVEADFGFTGHYLHPPSELNLTLYRAYDVQTGRWLSRDPLAEYRGVNLYRYARNNPINRVDRYGLYEQFGVEPGMSSEPPPPEVAEGFGMTAIGIIPGVGETMDVLVLTDPDSKW